jgi:hypothetical protein
MNFIYFFQFLRYYWICIYFYILADIYASYSDKLEYLVLFSL